MVELSLLTECLDCVLLLLKASITLNLFRQQWLSMPLADACVYHRVSSFLSEKPIFSSFEPCEFNIVDI